MSTELKEIVTQSDAEQAVEPVRQTFSIPDDNQTEEQLNEVFESANACGVRTFGPTWQENWIANWPRVMTRRGVSSWFRRFPGIPAVIVNSGPSLGRALPLLAEHQDRYLIIAVDNAVKKCMAAGVRPDVVATIDPQDSVAEMLSEYPESVPLAFCPYQSPRVIDAAGIDNIVPFTEIHNGHAFWKCIDQIYFSPHKFQDENGAWHIRNLDPLWGRLGCGGTVGTIGTTLAFLMDCDPIIQVGLDLSFERVEDMHQDYLPAIALEGIGGEKRFTMFAFEMSKRWYSYVAANYPDWEHKTNTRTWVNATGAGILQNNFVVEMPEDALPARVGPKINHARYLRQYLGMKPLILNR